MSCMTLGAVAPGLESGEPVQSAQVRPGSHTQRVR